MNQYSDTLKHIEDEYCKDDNQINIINDVLQSALEQYQIAYQNATNKQQYRDVKSGTSKAIEKVTKMLREVGQITLANDLQEALAYEALIKSKVLTKVSGMMKDLLIEKYSMSSSVYKNNAFHINLMQAFIECCENNPIKVPESYDNSWEPHIN